MPVAFPGVEKGRVLMFPVNIKLCGFTTSIRALFDRCRVRNISTNKLAMEKMFPEKGFRRIAIVVARWLDISYSCAYILMRLFSRTKRGGDLPTVSFSRDLSIDHGDQCLFL